MENKTQQMLDIKQTNIDTDCLAPAILNQLRYCGLFYTNVLVV